MLARNNPAMAFTSLNRYLDYEWKKCAYECTRKDGAVGVDGQTAEAYAVNLAQNLHGLIERAEQASAFVADKAYDADSLIESLYEKNIEPVIPSRKNRTEGRDLDHALYKARNLIERLFRRLKEFCRVATRYKKLDRHFAAIVMIACVCVWLN